MVNLVKAETKKLKGSSMLWIGLGGCFILPLMALGINFTKPGEFTWIGYTTQNLWPQVILLWPCLLMLLGTIATATPEQFGARRSDQRADVYGIGMLMLYLFYQ